MVETKLTTTPLKQIFVIIIDRLADREERLGVKVDVLQLQRAEAEGRQIGVRGEIGRIGGIDLRIE